MKKTKRIGIIYDPLHVSTSLTCRGGSLTQVHNAEAGEFVPDRELTPLVLVPEICINDPSGILPNGVVDLASVAWYALPQDVATQLGDLSYLSGELSDYLITVATEGYEVDTDGSLIVSKNIEYLDPVVLVFTANYTDIRSGNVLRLQAAALLTTTSVAVAASLSLDKPSSFLFNPMEDTGLRTITASLLLGGQAVDAEVVRTAYWWYKVVGGVESLVDPDDDLFYESGQGSAQLVIDPRYVDGALHLVCKAEYATGDDPLPSVPGALCLKAETTCVRRYPDYDLENCVHGGVEVSSGAVEVKNECVVTVGRNVLPSPSQWFAVKWTIRRAVTGAEEVLLGYGDSIMIDAAEFSDGADVGLEIKEIEPLKALAIDGVVITIDNKPITI